MKWPNPSSGPNIIHGISYKMSKIIHLCVFKFTPELRQKGNKLVKRQEVELYSGGALKVQVHKYQRNAWDWKEKKVIWKNIRYEAFYTRLVCSIPPTATDCLVFWKKLWAKMVEAEWRDLQEILTVFIFSSHWKLPLNFFMTSMAFKDATNAIGSIILMIWWGG